MATRKGPTGGLPPAPPPVADTEGIPEEQIKAIVSGGFTYASPSGTFAYVRENGVRMCWPEGVFHVSDPDIIRDLEYYVNKGQLVKSQLSS